MSKRRHSASKKIQILKKYTKNSFTARNLILTLRNRSQLDKWLKIYPDGVYIIK